MEALHSGVGGEVTDRSFKASSSKPIWTLTPLPLRHISPHYTRPRSTLPTLQSICLTSISENLSKFTPEHFSNLDIPEHILGRVFARIRSDRHYDTDRNPLIATVKPDESTIWALQALIDPNGVHRSHTLAIPIGTTLGQLPPNIHCPDDVHPLLQIPMLWNRHQFQDSTTQFLTTLCLDKSGKEAVNDESVQNLKYCVHLTALWTRGCSITDIGVRLLATSMELPGPQDPSGGAGGVVDGRGIWRLRAWWLSGCVGVSDRSMRVFARWPGLVLLDVRDTSCTTVSMGIFNRNSSALFSHQNADFQPCTPGLIKLFSSKASSSTLLLRLNTLLGYTDPIALHIVPATGLMHPSWLPPGSIVPEHSTSRSYSSSSSSKAFISGGIGAIYGGGVSQMHDEVRDYRKSVSTALRLTHRDEAEARDPSLLTKRLKQEKKERKALYSSFKKRRSWPENVPLNKKTKVGNFYADDRGRVILAGKIYKENPGKGTKAAVLMEQDKSKKFVMGNRVDLGVGAEDEEQEEDEDDIEGERELMMVRMVADHWESLTWAHDAASRLKQLEKSENAWGSPSQRAVPIASSETRIAKAKDNNLVENLMMASQSSTRGKVERSPSEEVKPSVASAFRPKASQQMRSSSPTSDPVATTRMSNPFKPLRTTSTNTSSRHNVKPLQSSQTRSSPVSSSASGFDDFASSTVKKRAFDGSSGGAEGTRRGLKMFSGPKL